MGPVLGIESCIALRWHGTSLPYDLRLADQCAAVGVLSRVSERCADLASPYGESQRLYDFSWAPAEP
jgi:hypothetical protein